MTPGCVRALVISVLLILVSSCSGGPQIVKNLDIEYISGWNLDVIAPQEAGPWPIVVLVHGAGLDRHDYSPFANRLAEAGAVVFNIDWDVLGPSLTESLGEIACGVRYARAHGPDFNGDPNRIVLVGHSTGAGYAGAVAIGGDDFDEGCPDGGSAMTSGLALMSTVQRAGGSLWATAPLGANPDLQIAFIHGQDDQVIGQSLAEQSRDVLQGAGYNVAFEVVPGGHFDLVLIERGLERSQNDGPIDTRAADRSIQIILDLTG